MLISPRYSHNTISNTAGFTLVELAIVLVILGLLTGGVLAGQSLIRSAELRTISTQYNQYKTALNAFKDKYFALPGDMPNAVKYWGAAAGATTDGYDATCAALTTPATSAATCNGDGDGHIGGVHGGNSYETYRSWQHLSNAGLIQGVFDGVGNTDTSNASITNTWRSRFSSNAIFRVMWLSSTYTTIYPHLFWGNGEDYGHVLFLHGAGHLYTTSTPVLLPTEAYHVDVKLDDGKPGHGIIRSYHNDNTWCITAANTPSSDWNLSSTSTCNLIMQTGF